MRAIVDRVKGKATTRARIATDVTRTAAEVLAVSGDARPPKLSDRDQAELRAAVADAAGVPIVVDAVHKADQGPGPPSDRLAGHLLALEASTRSAQAAPPRPADLRP